MELQMADLAVTDALFFERTGMDPARIEALVSQSLSGMDDGELYLEYSQSESLALDDGRIKSAASGHQPQPLHRSKPAWPGGARGENTVARRNRRLCSRS